MIPSSHAHPLSPPIETASSSSPFFASSPSQKSDLFDPPTSQTDALFPASPNAEEDVGRRGSVATLMARSSSAQGIGLGLRDSSVSRRSKKSATRSRASSPPPRPETTASSPNPDKVPRHLAFPSAPHRLSSSAFNALPLSHLVVLIQALSQRLDEAQTVLREEREELKALEKLARDKGAGDGEVERVKVRARTEAKEAAAIAEGKGEGEWRIELPHGEEDEEPMHEDAPLKTEVDLDLEDLTEAISSNAFDLGLTPAAADAAPSDDVPTRSRASSMPPPFSPPEAADKSDTASIASTPIPSTPSDASATPHTAATLKPVRQRHASLSARFVGYIAGGSGSNGSTSSAPAPNATITPASPSSATFDPTSSAHSPAKKRSGRSGSIRSVSSTASNERKGYGDWLGWRGWGKSGGAAESIKESQSDAEEEGAEAEARDGPAGGQTSDDASMASEPRQEDVGGADHPPGAGSLSSSPRPSLGDRATLASVTTDSVPSSPPTSSHSTALSPGRRSSRSSTAPNSPTSTRKRSLAPPPSLQPASQQATAAAVLSTPMTTSTISAPSLASPSRAAGSSPSSPVRSPSPQSLALPDTHMLVRSGEDEGEATIKARTGGQGQTSGLSFVPGVPLYSAPPGSAAKTATSDHGYVAAAKGSISRALGLGVGAPAGISRTNSSSTTSTEPNTTVFPRLPSLSLSRYSPFAQPALSTPATHVSLSASTSLGAAGSSLSSPLIAYTATLAPSNSRSGAQTMELDTISGEAAPPSLALLKPSYQSASAGSGAEGDDGDGPMIDRYGFIYDVRTGMELLKESRRRKEGDKAVNKPSEKAKKLKKKASKGVEADAVPAVVTTPQTELEVHPQLDALREAIGLTPTTEEENAFSPPPSTPQTGAAPTPSSDAASRPAKLVRAPSSSAGESRATSPNGTGPQSMRALLAQLRTITDAVEKTQQDAWDAFIRKRQKKLAKLKHPEVEDDGEKDAAHRRERPKSTVLLADRDMSSENGLAEQAWTSENLVGVAQMGTEKKGKKEDWNAFKQLVRKGIPIVYRPKIWGECSSANEAREPGVYQELLAQPTTDAEAQCLKQIDMDCHRTFPTCVFFAGNGPGVDKLRNVLVAYSRRNPKIGYCQGMNNLAATLLLTHPTEEDAFWVLVCIIENILPSDYYTSHLLVSRADQQVLRDLVERILPKFAAHLDEHGVELSAITFGWFLSLFTDCLPIQTLLRVWDLFFIHGTIFLFRVALAILKLHEAELLACDSAASLYALLGHLPAGLWNADRLLKVACDDLASVVKDRDVSLLRNKHVFALEEDLGLSAADDPPAS
ncbi:hypothetical protein NBRC10512_006451 [Rhodotorula toruloides]|uniref:RHTO0S03e12596g1_1 n=2 Tax=Rhodotorula toruloides TaxID=5286 RepID=A0A061AME4_RHOTO|nr:TBC domain protein, Rab GTPase activator [Rhodotorula toruloides NP11]EMS26163.1 TBC domain protein, Rab GTPase activator [Rhodotorula toruloides NP11]CDR38727.1 RHTO0S03e12596g1_1 [Rhodotorula toruloides]